MLDAVKVLFILTGASTYLVTKYINVGMDKDKNNDTLKHFEQMDGISDERMKEIWNKKKNMSETLSDEDMQTVNELLYRNNYQSRDQEYSAHKWPEQHVSNANQFFEQPVYEIEIIEEETDLPKRLLQIKAMTASGSQFSDSGVMFIVGGDGVDDENPNRSKFAINAFTGELFLICSIDRDPPEGRKEWRLNITAEDDNGRRLEGWAEIVVRVKDINDNVPYFASDNYFANMTENNAEGIQILTLTAQDVDENNVIKYSIEMNRLNSNGQLIFHIDEVSGVLSTAVCCLDRESIDQFVIKVCAADGGPAKACANVIIILIDQNDELPKFVTKLIPILINSNQIYSGKQISNLSVSDNDLLITNQFVYEVLNHSNYAKYFSVKTNTDGSGLLYIRQKFTLDQHLFSIESNSYEFSLTVAVSDCGHFDDITRIDYCEVTFKVQNFNLNNNQNVNSKTQQIEIDFDKQNVKNMSKHYSNDTNDTLQHIISNGYNSERSNNSSNDYFLTFPLNLLQQLTIFHLISTAIVILIIVLIAMILFIKIHHNCNLSSKLSTNNCTNESENESDHDLRDGIRSYNYEGGGECDISVYDLRQLQIPINLIDSSYATNHNKCDAMQKVLLLPDVCNKSPTNTTPIPDPKDRFEAINIFVVE